MNLLIRRLIECGMSRKVALSAARRFRGPDALKRFEIYVEEVEEESREPMEIL